MLVAVSGGSDSVALLALLERHARGRGPRLTVAHLDHGLRDESAEDRRFVEALAAGLSLACRAERREVAALRRGDESLEEAARRVRRGFLVEVAREVGAERIALGHTLDDQAETVVFRLVRGTGTRALGGMRAQGPGPFVRPLLDLERAELRDWLAACAVGWRDDPTNAEAGPARNRIRLRILPLLVRELHPQAARRIVATARRIGEDAAYLDALAGEAFARLAVEGNGRVALDAPALAALPAPLASRVARRALERARVDARRVNARHVRALLALAQDPAPRSVDLPGDLEGRRVGARVLVERRRPPCTGPGRERT